MDCPLSRGVETTPFKEPMEKVYKKWQEKKRRLQLRGIKVVSIYECQFLRAKEEDPELQRFLETYAQHRPRERLTLREGLRGGRCESLRHHFSQDDVGGRKKLYYFDINRWVKVALNAANVGVSTGFFFPLTFCTHGPR